MKQHTLLWLLFAALFAGSFIACKQAVIEPVPQLTVNDIRDYFWTSATTQTRFVDSLSATTNTLSFAPSGNVLNATDATYPNTKLTFELSQSQIFGTGFTAGSVIDLDPYSHFTSLDTVVGTSPRFITAVLAPKGAYVAATDRGIWSWNTNSGWTEDAYRTPVPPLSLLAADMSSGYVYGTSSNGLFFRSTSAPQWNSLSFSGLPAGPYNAFAVFGGVLYMAPASGGVYKVGSSVATPISGVSEVVTSLYPVADYQKLLIGTGTGSVYTLSASTNSASPMRVAPGMGRINCFQWFPSGLAVGTELGLFWNTNFTNAASWDQLYKGPIKSLAQRSGPSEPPLIGFISNQHVFFIDTLKNLKQIPQPPLPPIQFVPTTSSILTPERIMSYSSHWANETDSIPQKFFVAPEGGLTLLRSDATDTNKTWRAGTLAMEKEHRSYPITGRFVEHLDKLTIAGKDYPDVLQIRYGHEDGGVLANDTIPAWTVYYQLHQGPILFEKRKNGQVMRKQIAQ